MFENVAPGLRGEHRVKVGPEHTASRVGSGGMDVLATPVLVRLMEQAAVSAVDARLPEGYQTVGIHVDVRHLSATPPGMIVVASATLTAVDGRKLTFAVEAFDDVEKVGEGIHERMIVAQDRFLQRVAAKASAGSPRVAGE